MYNLILFYQVHTNGIISLDSPVTRYSSSPLPLSGSQRVIAPYWDNVDTKGTGKIFYRQTINPGLLVKTSRTIQTVFPMSQSSKITNLLIVTWNAVGYYPRGTNKVDFNCYSD